MLNEEVATFVQKIKPENGKFKFKATKLIRKNICISAISDWPRADFVSF